MTAAVPGANYAALSGAAELPAPVSGQRHEIGSPVGRLTYYSAGPEADADYAAAAADPQHQCRRFGL